MDLCIKSLFIMIKRHISPWCYTMYAPPVLGVIYNIVALSVVMNDFINVSNSHLAVVSIKTLN